MATDEAGEVSWSQKEQQLFIRWSHTLECDRAFNKVNAFEPVPFSADRQQQFYLYQLP